MMTQRAKKGKRNNLNTQLVSSTKNHKQDAESAEHVCALSTKKIKMG